VATLNTEEDFDDLDDPHSGRDLHRLGDQRISSGRVL